MKFECKLSPLGEYFLGGEKAFPWGNNDSRSPYFIRSLKMPSQTTILGMLRYLILEANDALFENEEKTSGDRGKLVGEKSFSFDDETANKYGIIENVGSLILYKDEQMLLPTPFNHVVEEENEETKQHRKRKEYKPFTMRRVGGMLLPDDYDAKEGLADSYMTCDGKMIIQSYDIFRTSIHTRNSIKEKALYKKEFVRFADDSYSFRFSFEINEESNPEKPQQGIVYLGQEKSAFYYEISELRDEATSSDEVIEVDNNKRYIGNGYECICLITDALVDTDIISLVDYSANDLVFTRSMSTNGGGNLAKKDARTKSKEVCLFKKGSVFYYKQENHSKIYDILCNETMTSIGYNKFYEIKEKHDEK